MQAQWTAIDQYIESFLIAPDPRLEYASAQTDASGYSNHLAVAPNQGMLLQMLVQMNQAKRVLEIGTYAAYSTIWLARGLPTDGYLLTIEGRDTHFKLAQNNLAAAKMPVEIDLRLGRAAEVLRQLPSDTPAFDLIFIDADKQSYAEYLQLSLNYSRSGTLIILDNVIRAGDIINPRNHKPSIVGLRDCFATLQNHPRLLSCTALQTVGCKGHDGLALALVK